MDNKNNSTCSICGKGYYVCISCKDQMKLHPYKFYTDTSEHYKVHQIIIGYSNKVLSKDEAREKLGKVDLSDIDSYKDNVKNVLNEILGSSQNEKTENDDSENKSESDEEIIENKNSDNVDVKNKQSDKKNTFNKRK